MLTAFSGAAISVVVAIYLGRQSVVAAGKTVAVLLAAAAIWLFFVGLHEVSADIGTKVLITKFQYLGTVLVPPAMLVACLQYAGLGYLVTLRKVVLLLLVPVITLLLVWTFPLHELYWQEVVWRGEPESGVLEYRRGPLFWGWVVYAYLSLLIGTMLLLNYLRDTPSVFRGQYFVLLVAILGPWVANVAYLLDLTPWSGTDTTAFGFVLTGLALGWGVTRLQMSNVVPLAQRSILESMTEAVFVMDERGHVVDLNPSAYLIVNSHLGHDSGDLIGRHVDEAFSELPALKIEVDKAIGQPAHQRNTEINLSRGRADFHHLRLSPVTDPAGNFLGTLIELRDVSSLKQAEEDRLILESQLREARKLESLGVMAGGIAHDFNNLLMGISGNAELAERKLSVTSAAAPHLKQIREISTLAAELCGQLLAYSGKVQLDIRVLSLNETVRGVLNLLALRVPASVNISTSLIDGLPVVEADPTQLQQLLLNLVINAIEAIGDATGEIKLSTECRRLNDDNFSGFDIGTELLGGDYVILSVADTGEGMDAETQEKIFDPFFTTKFTGRGLGLSAAMGIIQGHRAGLKIKSQSGGGTTFQIFLPASEKALAVNSTPAKKGGQPAISPGKILVIDDESYVRGVAAECLIELGFETLTASGGLEGIEKFNADQRDIVAVLLDLSMPEMDGEACYEQLMELDPEVSVIIMSGFHEKDVSRRFEGRDKLQFLQKPFKISQLQEAIQAVL